MKGRTPMMDNRNYESALRGYSKAQIDEAGFNDYGYGFPTAPGRATAMLVMKRWTRKGLVCYFDLDTGEKLMLTVWRGVECSYRPRESDVDMSYVQIGTRMEIAYDVDRNGKSVFLYANDGKEVYSA